MKDREETYRLKYLKLKMCQKINLRKQKNNANKEWDFKKNYHISKKFLQRITMLEASDEVSTSMLLVDI